MGRKKKKKYANQIKAEKKANGQSTGHNQASQKKKKPMQSLGTVNREIDETSGSKNNDTDIKARGGEQSKAPFQDLLILGDPKSLKQAIIEYIPVGLLTLIVYYLTLSPTVPGGDSGELITVSHRLGLSHPPGYPLYTMLGHLFSHLPGFSVAEGVNYMSGVFQVVAGFFLFATFRRWQKNTLVGWLIVGVFSFSPLVWRYAVVAEVFTLNNLFLSALIYLLYRMYEEPGPKWIIRFAALFGLACSHHHTILFMVVPFFLATCVFQGKVLFQPRTFLTSIGVWLLGFLPYLYMPFAAKPLYIFNWGHAHKWEGFWKHFLRQEYGTFQLASGKKDYSNVFFSLGQYFGDTLDQFLVVGVIPIAVAFIYVISNWKKQPRFVKTLVFGLSFYLIVFHVLANMDLSNRLFFDIQSRFWMAPNLIATLLFGWGILMIFRKFLVGTARDVQVALASGVMALGIGTQVLLHYRLEDYSNNYVFRDVGISMLDSLPKNAIAFLRGDIYVNVVRYLQEVEGYRTDVSALPFDLLWWPWMKENVNASLPDVNLPSDLYRYRKMHYSHFTLKELFDANPGREIFIGKLRSDELKSIESSYRLWNVGFLNKVTKKGEVLDFKTYEQQARGFQEYLPPKKTDIRDKSWEAFVYHNYWDRELGRGREIFKEAMKNGNDNEPMLLYGAKIMEKILANHPNPPLLVHKNLGVAYQFLGRINPIYNTNMYNAWKVYLSKLERVPQLAAQDRGDTSKIKMILSAYEQQRNKLLNQQKQQAIQRSISSQPGKK